MRRGTNVGKAYVSVTADGDGINEEIVDAVDDAGPGVRKKGKEHGEEYGDEFGDSLRVKFSHVADAAGDELNRRLSDSAPEGADDYGDNFEKTMKKSSKRIGKNIGDSLGKEINKSLKKRLGDLEKSLLANMDNLVNQVSGNGGGRGGSGGGSGAGSQSAGGEQTLYQSYDFYTKFEAARVAMHKAANEAIKKDDADLAKSQKRIYDKAEREFNKREAKRQKEFEAGGKAQIAFWADVDKTRIAAEKKIEARRKAAFNAGGKAQIAFWADVEKTRIAAEKKIEARRKAAFEAGGKAQIKFWADVEKTRIAAEKRIAEDAKKRDADLWKVRRATAAAYYKYLSDLEKGRIDREGNTIPGKRGGADKDLGDRVGGLLGKGSRNNFLNFFGSTLGNIIGLVDKTAKGAKGLFDTFAKGWKEAGEGATLFQKLMGGGSAAGAEIGGGLLSIAKAGPAAAAAIVVVVVAMSAMVSVASALLALVTALASTIVSALTGAVLVLGAAFAAAAVAGGLLVAAFLSMTDAQKKAMGVTFKPLKAELVGLGQTVLKDLIPHFETWVSHLEEAIALAGPLARVMGDAFGKAGDRLTASLAGPGFKNFFDALQTELPLITKRLSGALGGFLNGLFGIFAAILPLVTQFAGWLNRVAGDFSKWANSAQGQNSIKDFADRAVESLKSLWGFVKEFVGFIADVLFSPEAQNSGNTLFDSLRDSFKHFRDKIEEFQKNGKLEEWFKRAEKFGGQLKDLVIALKNAFVKLDNSGVLTAVGDGISVLAGFIEDCNAVLGPLVDFLGTQMGTAVTAAETALNGFQLYGLLGTLGSALDLALRLASALNAVKPGNHSGESLDGAEQATAPHASGAPVTRAAPGWALGPRTRTTADGGGGKGGTKTDWAQHLIDMGNAAMNSNGGKGGSGSGGSGSGGSGVSGNGGDGKKGKWHNPFVEWARSLIKDGPSLAAQLAAAMKRMVTQISVSINAAAKSLDSEQARSIISSQMATLRDTAKSGVQAARDALNSAAESLANATSKKEALRYLKQVRRAQDDLATALKNQKRLNAAAATLDKQKELDPARVDRLVRGLKAQNATLADFARARSILAEKIAKANSDLETATQLRDSYLSQVSDGIKTYGSLTTAQASVIDGIEQTLSATDITTNLKDRLAKIQSFQANLRILLANGLSNDAYQQIVDAGVEGGSAYAEALVAGGAGAIGEVNGLVSQIGTAADQLGKETSNRLYQAGVEAAQGIVDGLNSMADALDAAAEALGARIAKAIRKGLRGDSKGDGKGDGKGGGKGGGNGGKNKTVLPDSMAKVAVSPEVAQYAARQGEPAVSGNASPTFQWNGDIVTPTDDPHAVANEVVNEITGRLL